MSEEFKKDFVVDQFQKYKVKLKGDAGIYNVKIIDMREKKIFLDNRTCTGDWVKFDKIQKIYPVAKYNDWSDEDEV
jgi:hypothetical protein